MAVPRQAELFQELSTPPKPHSDSIKQKLKLFFERAYLDPWANRMWLKVASVIDYNETADFEHVHPYITDLQALVKLPHYAPFILAEYPDKKMAIYILFYSNPEAVQKFNALVDEYNAFITTLVARGTSTEKDAARIRGFIRRGLRLTTLRPTVSA